ncbi:MAG: hypothetical protein KDD53_10760, partial [Bdellovibrionales bacterium]|nr:hypothetical protein [Bdellovibrionales bacterium]
GVFICILNVVVSRSVVTCLIRGEVDVSGLSALLFLKLPVLALVFFLASRVSHSFLLSTIIGFLVFVPATLIIRVEEDSTEI